MEGKAYAVVYGVQRFRGYIIITDHQLLRWLFSLKTPSGRLARWGLLLQLFDHCIEYFLGKTNSLANMLLRPPLEVLEIAPTALVYSGYFVCHDRQRDS